METLISHGNTIGRKAVAEILEAGLLAADPYRNTRKWIRLENNSLIVGCKEYEPPGDPDSGDAVFNLSRVGSIYVVGAAKGVQRAAKAIEDILQDKLTGGHVIAKKGDSLILKKIGVTEGAHPVPDENCVEGCRKIVQIAEEAKEGDLVFTISGNGGSSLLTLPVPGVSIEEIRQLTYRMQIELGVPTEDLNAVRNHLDVLKVGRLSKLIHPATMIHILLWDPGDPLPSTTGTSGYERLLSNNLWLHALPDHTTFADAVHVLKKWKMWDEVPKSIRSHIEAADPKFETPKKEDFNNMKFRIFGILPRRGAIEKARKKAEILGFNPIILSEWLQAEARDAGRIIAQIAKNVENAGRPFKSPCVLITTGELLVTVGNERGIGGRNQEFILSAALEIKGSQNIVMGAVDTDGTDGPGQQFVEGQEKVPCLSGAIVDGFTIGEATKMKLDIIKELKAHNSSIPLIKLGDGVIATQGISLGDLGITLIL